jgi:pimeloyl-ACP methyl ester carboxylesterase
MFRKNLILLGSGLLILVMLHANIKRQDRNLDFFHSQITGQYKTPLLKIRLSQSFSRGLGRGNSSHPRALLIHGISASKSIMTQLGTELARCGIDCYLIDLPGHGESPARFKWEFCLPAIQEALQFMGEKSSSEPTSSSALLSPKIVLIGHSLGAGLAITAAQSGTKDLDVIAISPAAATITASHPRNLLILSGEFDLPIVRRGAAFIFERGTGMTLRPLNSPGIWENSTASRRLIVLPWTEHTMGIFRTRSFSEMVRWLKQLYPEMPIDMSFSWASLFCKFLYCAFLLLLFIPTLNLIGSLIQVAKGESLAKEPENARFHQADPPAALHVRSKSESRVSLKLLEIPMLCLYGLAGMLATLLLIWTNPWDRLHLMGGGYLSGFFCLTGLLALCFRRPQASSLKISASDFCLVFLSVACLVVFVVPSVSKYFVHCTLSLGRVWRVPIITLCLVPFYLFDEWASRCLMRSCSRAELLFFHLSSRLIFALVLLVGFFVLQNAQFLIVLVLPGLLGLSVLCWIYAGFVYNRTQSITASSLFSALSAAWFFSAFFAQV